MSAANGPCGSVIVEAAVVVIIVLLACLCRLKQERTDEGEVKAAVVRAYHCCCSVNGSVCCARSTSFLAVSASYPVFASLFRSECRFLCRADAGTDAEAGSQVARKSVC